MTEILSIVNQKGGVGKTTSAINLCAGLAFLGKRVLLVDLDPQANATTGLGIERDTAHADIYDALMDGKPFEEVRLQSGLKHLDIVPSSIDLAGVDIELVNVEQREYRLKNFLNTASLEYDFIFIDCPPSLGLLTVNALTASHFFIAPIQCEFYALDAITQLLRTISLVQKNLNTSLELRGILLTMFDPRTKLCTQVEKEVRHHFNEKVFRTVIPRSVRLAEAPSHGEPIFMYDPYSKGAIAYKHLTEEFLGFDEPDEHPQTFINNIKEMV